MHYYLVSLIVSPFLLCARKRLERYFKLVGNHNKDAPEATLLRGQRDLSDHEIARAVDRFGIGVGYRIHFVW